MKVGPKSSLRLFLHRALQLFITNVILNHLRLQRYCKTHVYIETTLNINKLLLFESLQSN